MAKNTIKTNGATTTIRFIPMQQCPDEFCSCNAHYVYKCKRTNTILLYTVPRCQQQNWATTFVPNGAEFYAFAWVRRLLRNAKNTKVVARFACITITRP